MKKRFLAIGLVAVMVISCAMITGCGKTENVTISFDSNGGSAVADVCVKPSIRLDFPHPTRDGYVFIGWLLDGKLIDEEDYLPVNDINLKAKWELVGTEGILYYSNDPFTQERGHTVTGYEGSSTEVVIPASYKGYPTLAIGEKAFDSNTDIVKVMTGNTARNIGEYAFQHCYSLTDIVIGKSIKSIETGAFLGCEALTSVFYCGSEEEWKNINIAKENENLLNATLWYYSEVQPEQNGNYWHFGSDLKTIIVHQKSK